MKRLLSWFFNLWSSHEKNIPSTCSTPNVIVGVINHVSSEYAFLIQKGKKGIDPIVKKVDLKYSWHGDLVEAVLGTTKVKGRPVAKITKILRRGKKYHVGRLVLYQNRWACFPHKRRFYSPIFLTEKIEDGKKNSFVKVCILQWSNKFNKAEGRLVSYLGNGDKPNVAKQVMLSNFNIRTYFPPLTIKESKCFSDNIDVKKHIHRRNFTSTPTFTIDPNDAQDFDDALSVIWEKDKKLYEIGIHIADVAHYVKEKGSIDREALKRGCSTYFPKEVIPMLPVNLSNHLCSLKPNEHRLALSVVLHVDKDGHIKKIWIGETIIFSQKRFTYEEVDSILKGGEDPFKKEILILKKIASIWRKKRIENGSIVFNFKETSVVLDKNGLPVSFVDKKIGEANFLVEEFMLQANNSVACFIHKKGITSLYRVHNPPKTEKIQYFFSVLRHFKIPFNAQETSISNIINKVLYHSVGKPYESLIQMSTMQLMSAAYYYIDPTGHFGLGKFFHYYTHFSSPIRRYPDLLVHRILKKYWKKDNVKAKPCNYQKIAYHCSERERESVLAERSMLDFYQTLHLQKQTEKEYKATIVKMGDYSMDLYITKKNKYIHVKYNSLKDDYYNFDSKRFLILGSRSNKCYKLGDTISIQIHSCNPIERKVEVKILL